MSQQFLKHPLASRLLIVDFTRQLAKLASPAEVLSGTPVVIQVSPPDAALTLGTPTVNASAVSVPNGEPDIPANNGITVECGAGTDSKTYTLRISCATNGGNTLAIDIDVVVSTDY